MALPHPSQYRWRDLARPAVLDLEPTRAVVAALLDAAGDDEDAMAELAIERALIADHGLWASGWRWSAEGGSGGPVAAWCCYEHSLLPIGEPDAAPTVARVLAALDEWWHLLGELEARFAAITADGRPDQAIARAAAQLLAFAVERTQAKDDWATTFATFLRWYLEARGHPAADHRALIAEVVAGHFERGVAPTAASAHAVIAALAQALSEPVSGDDLDGLSSWLTLREQRLMPVPVGVARVASRGDGHRRFVERVDRARDPRRAERMLAALAAVRRDAEVGGPLTVARLAAWQAIVLGEPAALRTEEVFAPGRRERYPMRADLVERLDAALAFSTSRHVPTAVRAVRAYLDVGYFQPFVDGNARAARLALDFVVTGAGLVMHAAEPVFLLPRDPADRRGAWTLTYVTERLLGTPTTR